VVRSRLIKVQVFIIIFFNELFHWYELFIESDSAKNLVIIVRTVFLCAVNIVDVKEKD